MVFFFSPPVTLFELTVVNNWYITMVRSNLLSVLFPQSHLCSVVTDQWVSLFDCCPVHSLTGRSHLYDEPLEPTLLHDLLHSYHGEACRLSVFEKYLQKFVLEFGLYLCTSDSESVCCLCRWWWPSLWRSFWTHLSSEWTTAARTGNQ